MFDDPRIKSCYSRKPATMSFNCREAEATRESRAAFLCGYGIDYRLLVCPQQIHSDRIALVTQADRGRGALVQHDALAGTDALITKEPGVPLAILTADCLPVFLFDPLTPAIGLCHAGWKGTLKKIVVATVRMMRTCFGTDPHRLQAGFGPAIRNCCYAVGCEFGDFFPETVADRNGHLYFDLVEENRRQLSAAGVPAGNFRDSGLCTSCLNQEFFSFRKEGTQCGRMISVLMLV